MLNEKILKFLGGKMGRARKPFIEKSTNIFLTFTNREIIELLEKFKIEYTLPDLVWDDETKRLLTQKIKEKMVNM